MVVFFLRHGQIHWDCVSVLFAVLPEEVEALGCREGGRMDNRARMEMSNRGSGQKRHWEELVLALTRLALGPAWPCSARGPTQGGCLAPKSALERAGQVESLGATCSRAGTDTCWAGCGVRDGVGEWAQRAGRVGARVRGVSGTAWNLYVFVIYNKHVVMIICYYISTRIRERSSAVC